MIQAAQQKVFQFSSDVQRMSVITRVMEEKEEGFSEPVTMVFCKGSPEMIQRNIKILLSIFLPNGDFFIAETKR